MRSHTKLARILALFIISGFMLAALAGWRTPRAVQAAGARFTVASTNNNGAGSLRQAIFETNPNSGADTISFNIRSGIQTSAFSSRLPDLTDLLTTDGATQLSGAHFIRLDGGSSSNFGKFSGNPDVSLSDGRAVKTAYDGPAELTAILEQNGARSLSLASGDFDGRSDGPRQRLHRTEFGLRHSDSAPWRRRFDLPE